MHSTGLTSTACVHNEDFETPIQAPALQATPAEVTTHTRINQTISKGESESVVSEGEGEHACTFVQLGEEGRQLQVLQLPATLTAVTTQTCISKAVRSVG